jgi:hypothetical protein
MEVCRERGITPVWVYLPMISSVHREDLADPGRGYAEAAGMKTMELHKCYGGMGLEELKVSDVDHHPNQRGHRLIAARLLEAMRESGIPPGLEDIPPIEAE